MLKTTPTKSDDKVEQLVRFTEHARDRGMEYGTIRQLLLSAGWKEGDIGQAFAAGLEIPIPKLGHKGVVVAAIFCGAILWAFVTVTWTECDR